MRKTLASVALLVAVVLAPLPGQAQGVKTPSGPMAAPGRDGACSAGQMAMVRRGFADARGLANRAIAALTFEAEATRPHLARFFGSNPAGAVAKNFRAISAGLDQREGRLVYECNRADACRRGTFAYVRWGGNAREVMGLCPSYFSAARTGQDSQGGIVLHEMSHLALRTRDHAYQPHGAEALAKDDPAAAQMNADSYEYFAEFLPR